MAFLSLSFSAKPDLQFKISNARFLSSSYLSERSACEIPSPRKLSSALVLIDLFLFFPHVVKFGTKVETQHMVVAREVEVVEETKNSLGFLVIQVIIIDIIDIFLSCQIFYN